jgi:hypothetical protein
MESEQVIKLTEEEAEAHLEAGLVDAWGFLKQAREVIWQLYLEELDKYDAYSKRQKETRYGREQGQRVEALDCAFSQMTSGAGRLNEITEKRWGVELE